MTPYPICWFLMFICCAISYWQPCVNLECTSDQMLQEQITWNKIPTSESNRYIFYKILIVDCTVPRFFQMSPTLWRVGAPGPQNWNSWLEHCLTISHSNHHNILWLAESSPIRTWGVDTIFRCSFYPKTAWRPSSLSVLGEPLLVSNPLLYHNRQCKLLTTFYPTRFVVGTLRGKRCGMVFAGELGHLGCGMLLDI